VDFLVSADIIRRYPSLRIGFVAARGLRLRDAHRVKHICDLSGKAAADLRRRFPRVETATEHPHIVAWQEVYRQLGLNPKRYRPTAEALVRRVLGGADPRSINPIVDIYLVAELRQLLPIGGYDLDRVSGPIELRSARAGEPFLPIGGEPERTDEGEIVYGDAVRVLTRRWNYRDCEETKITDASSNIVLMIEAPVPTIEDAALAEATEDLQGLLAAQFQGALTRGTFDARSGQAAVSL
jgi:DNA/RNA-binding domain of Phe-tRNA-synthetase-like protein